MTRASDPIVAYVSELGTLLCVVCGAVSDPRYSRFGRLSPVRHSQAAETAPRVAGAGAVSACWQCGDSVPELQTTK